MSIDVSRFTAALAGRYRIERELGRGGMAMVYLATDLRHERDVAIKVLREDVSSAVSVDRFAREIRLAAGLTHPHIVPLFDSGEADGRLFYVMPAVDGESLRERLARTGPFDPADVVQVARDVASALDYAHRHGTVHRDIKPENILLHGGHAVVTDFGIGKALTAASSVTVAATAVGIALGTPAYMSPEQASGDPVDGRSDLYALGCVMFELLTGQLPFTGGTVQEVIARRLTTTPPPVTAIRALIPASLAAVVARLMRTRPDERPQTGAELIDWLAEGRMRDVPAAAGRPVRSIVVLPFANLSADQENEYFSDGITEDIIGALARVPGLSVASRSSSFAFKGRRVPMAEIASTLNVSNVLEGSVRRVGQRVRITAQLVDVASDRHVWSERYDREMEDIFAVQDEIATAIAGRLECELALCHGALVEPPTGSLDAYHLYLKGRHLWAKRGIAMAQALPYFQQAVEADPGFAAAHAGLADAYSMLGVWGYIPAATVHEYAGPASRRALELDDRLAEAHSARGAYELYFGWDSQAADRHLHRAIELRPSDGVSRGWLAQLYAFQGRFDDAVALGREAQTVEPFSPLAQMLAGFAFAFAGRAAQVDDAADHALLLDEEYSPAPLLKGIAAILRGQPESGIPWLERAVALSQRAAMALAVLAIAYGQSGRAADAAKVLDELDERDQRAMAAWARAALGQVDAAFVDFEAAFAQRAGAAWGGAFLPMVVGLKDDPRWHALLRSAGLEHIPRATVDPGKAPAASTPAQ